MTTLIRIRKPDGQITELHGELISCEPVKQGHPYLKDSGTFNALAFCNDIQRKAVIAAQELRRFQAMGELPVEGKRQYHFDAEGDTVFDSDISYKIVALTAFFPTREAAEQALKDFGGWEHLRQVRWDFHMVGGEL
jgi:hypothetical protein